MDSKQIEFYEKVIDAIEVKIQLESVCDILKSKVLYLPLSKIECMELGIERHEIVAEVLCRYKKFVLENEKTP